MFSKNELKEKITFLKLREFFKSNYILFSHEKLSFLSNSLKDVHVMKVRNKSFHNKNLASSYYCYFNYGIKGNLFLISVKKKETFCTIIQENRNSFFAFYTKGLFINKVYDDLYTQKKDRRTYFINYLNRVYNPYFFSFVLNLHFIYFIRLSRFLRK